MKKFSAVTGLVAVALGMTTGFGTVTAADAAPQWQPACSNSTGHAHCQALVAKGARLASALTPADIQSAYKLDPNAGEGTTIAITDVGSYDSLDSDLAAYRKKYNLPECTKDNGCFKQVDQRGGDKIPGPVGNWSQEIALDLDAVSAACPKCKILLVSADGQEDDNDLFAAVDTAVKSGAKFVSNSWTVNDADPATMNKHFDHPGTVFAFATGDNGNNTTEPSGPYPANAPGSVSVGGTSLNGSGSNWSESAWSGAGSGCSKVDAAPAFQKDIKTGCDGKRASADLSAVADPNTGLNVYLNGMWQMIGGTSLATPLISAMWAGAGAPSGAANELVYKNASKFSDVTSGSNGQCGAPLCTAGTGWDGPTGVGTPLGKGYAPFKG